jgi:aspartyl/asparaginyl beta-hydroxylase (cupin superfamily)
MKEKIYYSFVERDGYKGNAPAYFDKDDFAWASEVELAFQDIKNELEALIAVNKMQPYKNGKLVANVDDWKTISVKAWGVNHYGKSKELPKTSKVFNNIPGLVSLSFNLLSAGSEIEAHHGDTSSTMRGHMGMIIPDKLPIVGFRVSGQEKSWDEGRILLFSDAHEHAAWNHSKQDRIILLFDVVKPEYLGSKHVICSRVLSALFLQRISENLNILKKLPRFMQAGTYFLTGISFLIFIPIRNFFSKLFS